MSTLQQRQREMMAYLKDGNGQIEAHIKDQGEVTPAQRLAIYHNAYRVRLRETLDTDHPILGTYLGDELYNTMVAKYIKLHPSSYRSLRQFGENLPTFLAEHSPFKEHPQIAELARFERFLLSAFDAADSKRATPEQLTTLPPEEWPALRFTFHPSVQLFISSYNVVEIWQALKAEQQPPSLLKQPHIWVLWRNQERLTEFTSISDLELQMLRAFLQGQSLAEVAEFPATEMPEDEAGSYLFGTLMQWLQRGWVQRLSPPEQACHSVT